MGRSDIEDPKLTEVKAILARLQRMDPDDGPPFAGSPPQTPLPPPVRPEIAPAVELLMPAPTPAVAERAAPASPQHAQLRLGAALLAGCATAALVLFSSKSYWLPQPSALAVPAAVPSAAVAPRIAVAKPEPAPTVAAAPPVAMPKVDDNKPAANPLPMTAPSTLSGKAALQAADRMISGGNVRAGRAELLRVAPEESADVAWALARSFDPNVVGRIDNADATPDTAEATKWYRQWHALAVRQGLVADSISIERIIRSMGQ